MNEQPIFVFKASRRWKRLGVHRAWPVADMASNLGCLGIGEAGRVSE
jgi:hypothetical protein